MREGTGQRMCWSVYLEEEKEGRARTLGPVENGRFVGGGV